MRSSSVIRPALARKAIVGLFAAFFSIALFSCAAALADTYTTGFEDFAPVSVDSQFGWMSPSPPSLRRVLAPPLATVLD